MFGKDLYVFAHNNVTIPVKVDGQIKKLNSSWSIVVFSNRGKKSQKQKKNSLEKKIHK